MSDLSEELLRLERALAERDPSGLDRPLEDLLADDFLEHGASGRVWSREDILGWLIGATPAPLPIEGFEAHPLADDIALATYVTRGERPANRSSIWVRRDGRWRLRFHQGTLRTE